ncbi:hypothetical protein ONZ51_g186 [Trametes cubensis]|uniref:F-box domain-containing protein n=1 Tax=Trametes cubensis TaxID=1111947 RepID=A0AAD7U4F3_9APHY|nr:hypothetical protein ONZ51_g186 [Trametes cubensis]
MYDSYEAVITQHNSASVLLDYLNEDVLRHIYTFLPAKEGLKPLSLTCKPIRESCKPVLFSRSKVKSEELTSKHFIHPSLWPFVQTLTFNGEWGDFTYPIPRFTPAILAQAMLGMPLLSRVFIKSFRGNGVPWPYIDAILTLPQLRFFETPTTLHHHAKRGSTPDTLSSSAAPLTSYQQRLYDYRKPPRYRSGDMEPLSCLVREPQVQQSLESLIIPIESAPFADFVTSAWPRLRVLSLRGGRLNSMPPYLRYFSRMPALRELKLNVAHSPAAGRAAFCPIDWTGPFPWPELRTWTVSFPDPDDPIYSLIPSWGSPILAASEMLRLVARCCSPHLRELDIEYTEDSGEIDLLRRIPLAFPNLNRLMIHRYRQRGADYIPIREIGESLAPLSRLEVLYLHLDLKSTPHPLAPYNDHGSEEFLRFEASLLESASIIARATSPPLKAICFLKRYTYLNEWLPFRIVRTDTNEGPHGYWDLALRNELDLISQDDESPPFINRYRLNNWVTEDR